MKRGVPDRGDILGPLNFPVITLVGKASRGVAGFLKSESRISTDNADFTDFSGSSSHPLNP